MTDQNNTQSRSPSTTRTEWLGQVRFEEGPWLATGRFDHEPAVHELRMKAWNVIGLRTKGSAYPKTVRSVTVTYAPGPALPFNESEAPRG